MFGVYEGTWISFGIFVVSVLSGAFLGSMPENSFGYQGIGEIHLIVS